MDVILGILLAVLLIFVLGAAVAALIVALSIRKLVRRNKITPDATVTPPVTWLAHPSAPARLHRRLRTAAAGARVASAAVPDSTRLAELTRELEREAIALDQQIVSASYLPTAERKVRLAALAENVSRVEQAASQVSLLSAQAQAPMLAAGQPSALDDLAAQLDALEEARAEVTRIEQAAGLHRASPYATGATRPPGTPQTG